VTAWGSIFQLQCLRLKLNITCRLVSTHAVGLLFWNWWSTVTVPQWSAWQPRVLRHRRAMQTEGWRGRNWVADCWNWKANWRHQVLWHFHLLKEVLWGLWERVSNVLIQNGDINHIYLNIKWEFFPNSLSKVGEGCLIVFHVLWRFVPENWRLRRGYVQSYLIFRYVW